MADTYEATLTFVIERCLFDHLIQLLSFKRKSFAGFFVGQERRKVVVPNLALRDVVSDDFAGRGSNDEVALMALILCAQLPSVFENCRCLGVVFKTGKVTRYDRMSVGSALLFFIPTDNAKGDHAAHR